MSENPIIKAWNENPWARPEFVEEILIGRYKSLYEWISRDEDIKVGLTDPD